MELSDEQRQTWQNEAAYWGVIQEDAERALNVAIRRRRLALGRLGMLHIEEEHAENDSIH